jgi:hypothetical protein
VIQKVDVAGRGHRRRLHVGWLEALELLDVLQYVTEALRGRPVTAVGLTAKTAKSPFLQFLQWHR